MAMFPIFLIGLLAGLTLGIAFTDLYFHYKQETPSQTQFYIQEKEIETLKGDIKLLENTNKRLEAKLKELKNENK